MTLLGAISKGLAISITYTHHFTMSYSFQRVNQGGILEFQQFKLVKDNHEVLQYHSDAIMHIEFTLAYGRVGHAFSGRKAFSTIYC
jgi:hypothetical protein